MSLGGVQRVRSRTTSTVVALLTATELYASRLGAQSVDTVRRVVDSTLVRTVRGVEAGTVVRLALRFPSERLTGRFAVLRGDSAVLLRAAGGAPYPSGRAVLLSRVDTMWVRRSNAPLGKVVGAAFPGVPLGAVAGLLAGLRCGYRRGGGRIVPCELQALAGLAAGIAAGAGVGAIVGGQSGRLRRVYPR